MKHMKFYQRRNMYHRCSWGTKDESGQLVRCNKKSAACWTTKDRRGRVVDVPVCVEHDKWIRANNTPVEELELKGHTVTGRFSSREPRE